MKYIMLHIPKMSVLNIPINEIHFCMQLIYVVSENKHMTRPLSNHNSSQLSLKTVGELIC